MTNSRKQSLPDSLDKRSAVAIPAATTTPFFGGSLGSLSLFPSVKLPTENEIDLDEKKGELFDETHPHVIEAISTIIKKCSKELKKLKVNASDIKITLNHFIKECIEVLSWLETNKDKISIIYYAYTLPESVDCVITSLGIIGDPSYLPDKTFHINKDSLKLTNTKSNLLGTTFKTFPTDTISSVYVPICYASTGDTCDEQDKFKRSMQEVINTFVKDYKVSTKNIHPYLGPHDATTFIPSNNELRSEEEVLSEWLNENKRFFECHIGMKFLIHKDEYNVFPNTALRVELSKSASHTKAKEIFYKMLCDGRIETKLHFQLYNDVNNKLKGKLEKSIKKQSSLPLGTPDVKVHTEEKKETQARAVESRFKARAKMNNEPQLRTISEVEEKAEVQIEEKKEHHEPVNLLNLSALKAKEAVVVVPARKIAKEKTSVAVQVPQQIPSTPAIRLFEKLNSYKHQYPDKFNFSKSYGEMYSLLASYYLFSFVLLETTETIPTLDRVKYLKYYINDQVNFGIQLVEHRRDLLIMVFRLLSRKIEESTFIAKFGPYENKKFILSSIYTIQQKFCPIECKAFEFNMKIVEIEHDGFYTPNDVHELVSQTLMAINKLSEDNPVSYKTYISIFDTVAKLSIWETEANKSNFFPIKKNYIRWKILSEIRTAAFNAFQLTMIQAGDTDEIKDNFNGENKSPEAYTHEALGQSLFCLPLILETNITSTAIKMKAICKEVTDLISSKQTVEYLLNTHLKFLEAGYPDFSIFKRKDFNIPRSVIPETFTQLVFNR
jgi:hypothetical protein